MGRKRLRMVERRKTLGLSQESLAEAMHVETSTVARWERGETTPQPWHRPHLADALKVTVEEVGELLAETDDSVVAVRTQQPKMMLDDAATRTTSATVSTGRATHVYVSSVLRTLESLGVFVRSDMLTRRDILAASVTMATGKALVEPLAGLLDAEPTGLSGIDGGLGKIGTSDVEGIEHTVRQFIASDASAGGGLVRDAALGQLKYTVDLAQHASYSEAVGNRLLNAIAHLSGWVGWMSHDAGMDGPAQRYFWYGLQAAHEAGTDRARLRAIGILADMARQVQAAGHLDTARRLVELAIDWIPDDKQRFNAVRALLWNLKANVLSGMGATHVSEVDRYVALSFDLHQQSRDDEYSPAVAEYYPYTCEAELASTAAATYRDLAREDSRLAARAQTHARYALDNRSDDFARSKVFDHVTLTRARLYAGEIDQACQDGREAIQRAVTVSQSKRVRTQLTQLMHDTAGHQQNPAVRELREELRVAGVAVR